MSRASTWSSRSSCAPPGRSASSHKIEVSRRSREDIIRQLATAGVTITAVFPDLTNLATELREYWS